jgi:hypothetical protein
VSLFRRRRAGDDEATGQQDVTAEGGAEEAVVVGEPAPSEPAPEPGAEARGPLDESEVDDDVVRLDLGALRVPPRPGMELRLELEDTTQRVVAATIGIAGSTVQLQAFAAPRTEGIWDEIRTEIAAQVTRQGGSADEVPGSFGRELLARLPVRTPDGRTAHRPARFVGVDGPRWFLRGVFSGPAAADDAAAAELEEVVRGTVVVRGAEAMAPRDLLPLKLPAQGQGPGQVQPAGDTRPADQGDGADGSGPPTLVS